MADNVIRPAFGKKPAVQPPQKVENTQVSEPEDVLGADGLPTDPDKRIAILRDIQYMLADMEHLGRTRDRLHYINDFVFSLQGFDPSQRNIEIRREGLQSATLESLCEIINASDETQWKTKPNYFGSVTLEYQQRIERLIKLFPK